MTKQLHTTNCMYRGYRRRPYRHRLPAGVNPLNFGTPLPNPDTVAAAAAQAQAIYNAYTGETGSYKRPRSASGNLRGSTKRAKMVHGSGSGRARYPMPSARKAATKRVNWKRGSKKRKKRKRKRPTPRRNARSIKLLQKKVGAQWATHTHRSHADSSINVPAGARTSQFITGTGTKIDLAKIKDVLGYARIWDGDNLVNEDLSTGSTGSHELVRFTSASLQATYRNVGMTPVNLTVYFLQPRFDHSNAPDDAVNDGLTDQSRVGSGLDANNLLSEITDSAVFRNQWRIVKKKQKWLAHGTQMTVTCGLPAFNYNPSVVDEHTVGTYKTGTPELYIMIRSQGAFGITDSDDGFLQGKIRSYYKTQLRYTYDAGKNLHDFSGVFHDLATPAGLNPRVALPNNPQHNPAHDESEV